MDHIEIHFNLNRKKEFYFCSSVQKTETFFGIVIIRDGWRNCIVNNEEWIAFPKSQYANSNPANKDNPAHHDLVV